MQCLVKENRQEYSTVHSWNKCFINHYFDAYQLLKVNKCEFESHEVIGCGKPLIDEKSVSTFFYPKEVKNHESSMHQNAYSKCRSKN